MSTATKSTAAPLRGRLDAARARLRDLRDEQAHARSQADAARDRFAAADGAKADPGDPLYSAALAARRRLDAVTADLEAARDEEVKLLELMSGGGRPPREVGDLSAPGGWLSSIALGAGPLAEAIDGLTTDSGFGSRTDVGSPFIDRLTLASALMRSGVTTLEITTTEVKLPRLADRLVQMAGADVPTLDTPAARARWAAATRKASATRELIVAHAQGLRRRLEDVESGLADA